MKMTKRLALWVATLAATAMLAEAAPVVTLTNPDALAAPGTLAGWGFSVTGDPTQWVAFIGSQLVGETNPTLGLYTDLIGAQGGPVDFVLPPAQNWDQPDDPGNGFGVGQYLIDPFAAVNATNSGSIRVLYEVFSDNPNTCGGCYVRSGEQDLAFTVTVEAPSTVIPEPGSLAPVAAAGLLLTLWKRRCRRKAEAIPS